MFLLSGSGGRKGVGGGVFGVKSGRGGVTINFALGTLMGAACVRVGDRFLFVWVLAQ